VRVNSKSVEVTPSGIVLMLENRDRPGIIGHIGTFLGQAQINIASMSLSRTEQGGRALTLLNLDSQPSSGVMEKLTSDPDIFQARVISL
jgi:D-3-phosphoglycerate dehydrogenase